MQIHFNVTVKNTYLQKCRLAQTEVFRMVRLSIDLVCRDHFLSVFVFAIMWSVFRGRSCAPLVSQLLNMVLNWNFLFDKLWRLVTWSGHWFAFHRLEAISDNVKMTSAISVTCRENLFVKVSYLQYHALHFLTWGR